MCLVPIENLLGFGLGKEAVWKGNLCGGLAISRLLQRGCTTKAHRMPLSLFDSLVRGVQANRVPVQVLNAIPMPAKKPWKSSLFASHFLVRLTQNEPHGQKPHTGLRRLKQR
jgi:hypothetical protein